MKHKLSKKAAKLLLDKKRQERADRESFDAMKDKWANVPSFSSRLPGTKVKSAKPKTTQTIPQLVNERLQANRELPSLHTNTMQTGMPLPKRYADVEMQAREERAQEELREKQKLAMPLYNKGPAQLPTSADLEAYKRGELRRR